MQKMLLNIVKLSKIHLYLGKSFNIFSILALIVYNDAGKMLKYILTPLNDF